MSRAAFGAAGGTPVSTRRLADDEPGILVRRLRGEERGRGARAEDFMTRAVGDDSVFLASPMPEERRRALRRALERCNTKGGSAKIWSYHVTHSMLHLRVELPDGSAEDICCGACRRIECSPWWRDVRLRFEEDALDSTLFHLVDDEARFHVACGVVLTGCPVNPSADQASDTG